MPNTDSRAAAATPPISAQTWIEVSASALRHNIEYLRRRVPAAKLAVVIKSNAYGHGRDLVAAVLAPMVNMFAVADAEDALSLAAASPNDVLLLAPVYGSALQRCVAAGVVVTASSWDSVDALPPGARVHVLVDTGLHRLGLDPSEVAGARKAILARGAVVEGAYCHVGGADSGDWADVEREVAMLRALAAGIPLIHTGGSSLTLERPDLVGHLARLGITVYGHLPAMRQQSRCQLLPALSLKSRILEIRTVPSGERIGYHPGFVAQRSMVVATIPVGVSHGLDPRHVNGGLALVRGVPAPFVGGPSLDYALLDVTDVRGASRNDIVQVLGGGPGEITSVERAAQRIGVVVDHVLCRLSPTLPRYVTA